MVEIIEATTDRAYRAAVQLFKEYQAAIGIDLEFQNFKKEIQDIKAQYSRPEGGIFVVYTNKDFPSGCFGVRKLTESICELKRMYLKPEFQGLGIGTTLMEMSFEFAKELGYEKMRLDTLDTMHAAIALYTKMGFYEIEPYRFNPLKGAKYFEVDLLN